MPIRLREVWLICLSCAACSGPAATRPDSSEGTHASAPGDRAAGREAARKAESAHAAGDHAEAIRQLRVATPAILRTGDRDTAARLYDSVSEWASSRFDAGAHREARDYFQITLLLVEGRGKTRAEFYTAASLGNVQNVLGNYQAAEILLRRAAPLAGSDPERRAYLELSLGCLDYNTRSYVSAATRAREAIRAAERCGRSGRRLRNDANVLLAAVYRQQGDFDLAIGTYEGVLPDLEETAKGGDKLARLSLENGLRNLGEVHKARAAGDDLDRATRHLERALAISRKEGAALRVALTIAHQGEVAHKRGRIEEARELYADAIRRFRELHYNDGVARYLLFMGDLEADRSAWAEAERYYDEAVRRYEDLTDREWLRLALYGLGRTAEASGDLERAETCYRRAADAVQDLRLDLLPEVRERFERTTDDLYERLLALLAKQGKPDDQLLFAGRSWSEGIRSQLGSDGGPGKALARQGFVGAQYEALAAHLRALAGAGGAGAGRARTQLAELESIREELLDADAGLEDVRHGGTRVEQQGVAARYSQAREHFTAAVGRAGAAYPDALRQLDLHPERLLEVISRPGFPDDRALVVYFTTPRVLYIFVGTKDRVFSKSIPVEESELRAMVESYRRQLSRLRNHARGLATENAEDLRSDEIASHRELAGKLHRLLIEPVEGRLVELEAGIAGRRKVGTVGILPMGPLVALPFQAMISRRAGREGHWIEQINLVYLSYLNVEQTTRDRRQAQAFGRSARALVLTNPDGSLRFAEDEGRQVAACFGGGEALLTRASATIPALRGKWSETDIVHIAAHAHYLAGNRPGEPYVELAPSGEDDGRLTPTAIRRLPSTSRAKLVVLSACSTALADEKSTPYGTHLETLASAFSAQQPDLGHVVVATLWDVDDRSTSVFMGRFYRELSQGQAPYDALRATQLWMLTGEGDPAWEPRFAQPYHWAAFVFVGSW